ncbi:hypothetical protein D3C86_878750 [compost metagenome]
MPAPMITALPTPPQRSDAPDVFVGRADGFLGALPTFRDETNALALYFDEQVTAVEDLVASAGFAGTSTSAIFIGTGAKTLFTQAGLSFLPGVFVSLADSAAPTVNAMIGVVTGYNVTTGALAVDVRKTSGAGEKSAWTISLSGPPGSDATVTAPAITSALGYTPVNKAGDTMTGPLVVGPDVTGSAIIQPGAIGRPGSVEFRINGVKTGYVGFADSNWNYLSGEAGRGWQVTGGDFRINGVAPWTSANDGSGSGLDADLLRGAAPDVNAVAWTVVQRLADGAINIKGATISSGALYFSSVTTGITAHTAGLLKVTGGLYLDTTLSASDITHRSDRRLKKSIADLETSNGRLRPVSYELKATGERRVGFIAQEVAKVRPDAVRENADGILEIDTVALIAELSRQLNWALDRLDVLEGGHGPA